MKTPNIGDIVHYLSYGTPGGEYGKECRSAIITQVNEDGTVGLAVFNPTGTFFNSSIPGDFNAAHDQRAGGTWHWPEHNVNMHFTYVPSTTTTSVPGTATTNTTLYINRDWEMNS